MTHNMAELFVVIVFLTVFVASQIIVLPSFGSTHGDRRKLKKRLDDIIVAHGDVRGSIVKLKYLNRLGPLERIFEDLPGIKQLKSLLEQAGSRQMAYRFALMIVVFAGVMGLFTWWYFHNLAWVFLAVAIGIILPFWWLKKQRTKRLDKFEEQLPEALQMMSRALRTGYSFLESMKVVSTEMAAPISEEFMLTFEEINYGRDVEVAFDLMIERVPNLSLIAMTTAIIIHKETGGNLSEVLLKISAVLNGRFKLRRRIKTLSAEGVMSAWVLLSLPFALFLVIHFLSPDYFTQLFESQYKIKFIEIFLGLEFVAMVWIRFIINIDA